MDPFYTLAWVLSVGLFFSFSRVFFSFQTLPVCQVPTVGDHCRHDACSKSYINPEDIQPKSTFLHLQPSTFSYTFSRQALSVLPFEI
ncbi:hypothetical protein BDV40DRAFT_155884 [Aspergillus tamarii]|uniref:Uncharacterized protein n=1 Tax=Aspergillus tamarii TaxID=41984 RepID=A0A5N6UVN2_ASPTM|nr:hypothetical protein BDV40DRAFT_155884 [Aspergillus tamarii]